MKIQAQILNGKPVSNPIDIERLIQFFHKNEGKYLEINYRKPSGKRRSLNQNAYYWGVVVKNIALEAGYVLEGLTELEMADGLYEAHKWLKFSYRITAGVEVEDSTAEMDTQQFEDYMSHCRYMAKEYLNITINEPNQKG